MIKIPWEISPLTTIDKISEEIVRKNKKLLHKKALENYFAQKLEEEKDYKDVVNSLAEFKASKGVGKIWEELQKELEV